LEESKSLHIPVMLNEIVEAFSLFRGEPLRMLDGTFGRGGHSRALLDKYSQLKIVGVDRDRDAVAYARSHFPEEMKSGRLSIFHGSFGDFVADEKNLAPAFDLILLDLGVSSPQYDEAERGFSFYHDGPLDMRMNQDQITTAATIINEWDEEDIIDVFKNYGEVRSPYRVIRALLHDRKTNPFTSTRQLAGLIERVEGWRQKGKHPATQYFLGLRLMINQELEQVKNSLVPLIRSLVPGGIIAVITFHSLEDRIVKNIFKENGDLGFRINKKVIVPSDTEEKENPRSRSAKLRVFQRSDET
jgi:16S rRNA (cytosine1402-N4)-methyltransferase